MKAEPCVIYGSGHRSVNAGDSFLLQELGTYLFAISDQQQRAIRDEIAPRLGLDARSRGKERKITSAELYCINKAMALEMLLAHTMAGTDTPRFSQAHCALRHELPHNFAPPGFPDVTVDYGNGYVVLVEASAKRDMSEEYYDKQLQGALRHMRETGAKLTLLVTGWGQAEAEARTLYREFVRKNKEGMRQRNILPFSIKEFSCIASNLASDLEGPGQRRHIRAEDMPGIFRDLIKAARSGKEQSLGEIWEREAKKVARSDDTPTPNGGGPSPGP